MPSQAGLKVAWLQTIWPKIMHHWTTWPTTVLITGQDAMAAGMRMDTCVPGHRIDVAK